jgi:peptide/nickel transport system permease protein
VSSVALEQPTRKRRSVVVPLAVTVLTFWVVIALFAPLLAPYSESAIMGDVPFAPAGQLGLLGTDYLGRDLLSRLVYGCRTTLLLALSTNIIASCLGITTGFIAAVGGRWIDEIASRLVDGLLSIPTMMFALVCVSALGASTTLLVCTVGVIEAIRVFRIARSVAINCFAQDYVELARARGESMTWILSCEILPNALSPLLTDFGVRFSAVVMLMSAISFLGLGVQPPHADWAMMVRENIAGLRTGSLACLLPATAIYSVTFSANTIVDWILRRSHRGISAEIAT